MGKTGTLSLAVRVLLSEVIHVVTRLEGLHAFDRTEPPKNKWPRKD